MKIWKTFLPLVAVVVLMLTLISCEVKKDEHPKSDHPVSEQKSDPAEVDDSKAKEVEKSDHPEAEGSKVIETGKSDHPSAEHPQ